MQSLDGDESCTSSRVEAVTVTLSMRQTSLPEDATSLEECDMLAGGTEENSETRISSSECFFFLLDISVALNDTQT